MLSLQKLKYLVAGMIISSAPVKATQVTEITGAGATFPYPLYAKWAEAYEKETKVKLNYQSIGSGGGIKQIKAKTVDFGASDKPLTPEELKKDGLMQFPAVMGAVVVSYNLKGVEGKLQLDSNTLAEIFLGTIKKWNDPKIQALNKDAKLPDKEITVVYRSDGSGTTFLFTDYLSKVSKEWKEKVGSDAKVSFPSGVGGKGNEGVAANITHIDGALGYVEYAYAKQNKLPTMSLKNKDGNVVEPSLNAFKAAAANAKWEAVENFYLILTDQPGKDSWPITGATFILLQTKQEKPENGEAVLKFFDWCFNNGDEAATKLDYVALPANLEKLIRDAWKAELKDAAGKPLWK